MKRVLIVLVFVILSVAGFAQDKIKITEEDYKNEQVEMADNFRKEGKIYVLTGVICLILGGMLIYLVVIDRKISKIEKQLPDNG